MNWWRNISNIGIDDQMTSMDKRRARLSNRMIFIGCLFTVPYIFIFASFESKAPLICVCLLTIGTISLFTLCQKSKHEIAATLMVILASSYLLATAILIESGSGYYYLIPISLFGFALLESKIKGILLFCFCALTFFAGHFADFFIEPSVPSKGNAEHFIFLINLTLIFLGTLYFFMQMKSTNHLYEKNLIKQQRLLELQHQELQTSHEEIQDSIRYAKRIQNGILPASAFIKETLTQHFVFYQPKDIVAGDFYWVEKAKEKIFIAAADCTGHGVPGAMVSVVCNNALNRSIREFNLQEPGLILDKAREIVIQEFSKSDEDVKDGMDIALCSIQNLNTKPILTYSGANNPLWIFRKNVDDNIASKFPENSIIQTVNDVTFIEIKADKQPVGKFEASRSFSTHEIPLQKGDILYLFTDGYADQFGGEKGKKFKAKNLRSLLFSNLDLSLNDQKKALEQNFENWKGSLEQIDDVCVIGVKI